MSNTPTLAALLAVLCGEADTVRPMWNQLSRLGWCRYTADGRFVATPAGKAFARHASGGEARRTEGAEL